MNLHKAFKILESRGFYLEAVKVQKHRQLVLSVSDRDWSVGLLLESSGFQSQILRKNIEKYTFH